MEGEAVEEFLISMDQAVEDQLARSPGWLRRDAFVRVASDYLIEDGTLEDLEVCLLPGTLRPQQDGGRRVRD